MLVVAPADQAIDFPALPDQWITNAVGLAATADSGFAVVYSVQADEHQLVIDVVADKSAVIGQVVYRTAHFARVLART